MDWQTIIRDLEERFGVNYVPALILSIVAGMVKELVEKKNRWSRAIFLRAVIVSGFAGTLSWLLISLMDWPMKAKLFVVGACGFSAFPLLRMVERKLLQRIEQIDKEGNFK